MLLPFKQASLINELKNWCQSKLKNIEVHFTGDPSIKLRCSSSLAEGLDEGLDEAVGAGLSVVAQSQEGSSQVQDLADSPALLDASQGQVTVEEVGSANHYFVVRVENSPGNRISNHHMYSHTSFLSFLKSRIRNQFITGNHSCI